MTPSKTANNQHIKEQNRKSSANTDYSPKN